MVSQSVFDVTGRVILVTGGSSGLGLQIARVMVRAGAKVASVARAMMRACARRCAQRQRQAAEPVFISADIREQARN